MADPTDLPVLHVCITCRTGQPLEEGDTAPGQHMYDAVAAALAVGRPGVELRAVQCLSSCDHGCAAAISSPGKWTYLLGRLEPSLVADLLAYADSYARAATGTVLPSRRPATLGRMILGRMPDLTRLEVAATRLEATA